MSTEPSALAQAVQETAIGSGMMGAETTAQQLDLLRDAETGQLPKDVFRRTRRAGPGRPPGSKNKLTKQIAKMIVQTHGDPVMELASIGFMPLDQMVEMLTIATGHNVIEDKLVKMADEVSTKIQNLGPTAHSDVRHDLTELSDNIFYALRKLQTKPGDLAAKALAIKKDALKEVSAYTHGKQPITVDVTGKADVILNIAGMTDPEHLARYADGGELSAEALEQIELAEFTDADDD